MVNITPKDRVTATRQAMHYVCKQLSELSYEMMEVETLLQGIDKFQLEQYESLQTKVRSIREVAEKYIKPITEDLGDKDRDMASIKKFKETNGYVMLIG